MKRIVLALAIMLCAAVPSYAGSAGVYGSYWDGGDAGSAAGGGARLGFNMFKWMELEFRGTYYVDFEEEIQSENFELTALPVDGGLRFNLLPESRFNFYLGAGVTYFFMDTNLGSIDDEFSYYGSGGMEFGGDNTKFFIEAVWRDLSTSVDDPSTGDPEVDFSGISGNIGINWRW